MVVSSIGPSPYREPLRPRVGVTPLSTGLVPVSPGITPALSLLRAHAPDLNPLTASVLPLYHESLQVAARPCWKQALPSVISANLSLDAWTHTPVVPTGALTRFFPGDNGLHHARSGSALNNILVRQLLYGVASRGYSHSLMFRPPGLLATQVAPTASRSIPIRAAVAFTSTHISVCCLPEQWIC
jgi:hypothetical protein